MEERLGFVALSEVVSSPQSNRAGEEPSILLNESSAENVWRIIADMRRESVRKEYEQVNKRRHAQSRPLLLRLAITTTITAVIRATTEIMSPTINCLREFPSGKEKIRTSQPWSKKRVLWACCKKKFLTGAHPSVLKQMLLFFVPLLLLQLELVLGLKHAYLEKLTHQALSPLFPDEFLNDFLEENDFLEFSMNEDLLEVWNQRALKIPEAVEKLKRISQLSTDDDNKQNEEVDFANILRDSYFMIAGLKPIMEVDSKMQHEDIIMECIVIARILAVNLADTYELDVLEKYASNINCFVLLVHSLHANPNIEESLSYLKYVNDVVEETEILLRPVSDLPSVIVKSRDFLKMHFIAEILLHSEKKFRIGISTLPKVFKDKTVPYAERVIRLANFANYHMLRIKASDASTKLLEYQIDKIILSLNLVVSHTSEISASPKQKFLLDDVLTAQFKRPRRARYEKIEKQIEYHPTFFHLPISIWRMLMLAEEVCSLDSLIQVAKVYRTLLAEVCSRRFTDEEYGHFLDSATRLLPKSLPIGVINQFVSHFTISRWAYFIDPEVPHFSSLSLDMTSEVSYIEMLAWWCNRFISKQPQHFGVFVDFIQAEAEFLFSQSRAASSKLALALMLKGGLKEYTQRLPN